MTDEEKNIFGNQLRERRNELNLTTQKVALDAEVGESTYKRLEAGDGNPRLDTLVRIAKCLKTDLNSVVPQEHLCKDSGIWQIVRKLLSMDNLLEGKEYEYISEEEEIFYPTLYAASTICCPRFSGHELLGVN